MGHSHLKLSWLHYQLIHKDGILTYSPPLPPSSVSPYTGTFDGDSSLSSPSSSSGSRISPAVLFVIVILAVLFFISGLLHLLVRFLVKNPSSDSQRDRYPEMSGPDAIDRQLQQLFHLHDSGLDQAFIDALPVFQYKEIVGLKEPFDCAVCLCEFSEKDKLRLLPMCSHAFHINCIDTWLLTNSSCPLCRGTLFSPGCSIENPMFDFDYFQDDDGRPGTGENEFGNCPKTVEIEEVTAKKGVLPVRLGKFRRLDDGNGEGAGGETSSSNLDARRCFSMGSYQYILADSDLRVALTRNQCGRDIKLPRGIEPNGVPSAVDGDEEEKKIKTISRRESFSVSKIWLWPKNGKFTGTADAHIGMPSSLNVELPWMSQTQEK